MIRFPRRLNLGFRPWYGLTMRQLAYLLFAAMLAGLLILTGPTKGAEFIARIVAGLLVIGTGVALAFFRFNGMTLERWIIARIQFLFKPQRLFWSRGEGRRVDANAELRYGEEPAVPTPASEPVATSAPAPRSAPVPRPLVIVLPREAIVIFADLAMVLAFFTLTIWLKHDGCSQLQLWYMSIANR